MPVGRSICNVPFFSARQTEFHLDRASCRDRDHRDIFRIEKTSVSILRLESQADIGSPLGEGNIQHVKHISSPHLNRSNTLYFDGHVGTFSRKNMTDLQVQERMKIE